MEERELWRAEHIHPFPVLIKTLSPHHVGIVIVLLRYCGVENCVKEKIFWSILTQASFVKSVCCFYKRIVAVVYTVIVIVECGGKRIVEEEVFAGQHCGPGGGGSLLTDIYICIFV